MDTVIDRAWTADSFIAWDDRQEGKHEFNGRRIIPMTGGSVAHQDIVFNVRGVLGRVLASQPYRVVQEMRLRVGEWVRYPDVIVCAGRPNQATRTVTDAVAIVEVVSENTAATLYRREPAGPWIATAHMDGEIALPGLGVTVPLADFCVGLEFAPEA